MRAHSAHCWVFDIHLKIETVTSVTAYVQSHVITWCTVGVRTEQISISSPTSRDSPLIPDCPPMYATAVLRAQVGCGILFLHVLHLPHIVSQ
jgi:hypothetical protein